MNRLVIIDSNYLCYFHRYGLSDGLTYRGNNTEIIFNFLRSVLDLAKRYGTTDFVFAWDSPYSLRRETYPLYKRQRAIIKEERTKEEKENDAKIFKQFDTLRKKVLPKLGFRNVYQFEGYEADDIIAEAVNISHKKRKCVIVTADEDMCQLLDRAVIYNVKKHETMNEEIFTRQYKIKPKEWVKVKQLGGCTTDNVKGIPGIGEGRAISYIRGELKGAYKERIDNDKGETEKRNLPLVKLPLKGIPSISIRSNWKIKKEAFKDICKKYGFESFLKPENKKEWWITFDME